MPNSVVHVELRGLDVPSLATFYRDIFGWEGDETLSIEGYPVAGVGTGSTLTAGIGPVPEWSTRSAIFYIQVDDIDGTLRQIEAAGGKAVMPRTEGPPVGAEHIRVFTTFLDPAGNEVGLVETPRT